MGWKKNVEVRLITIKSEVNDLLGELKGCNETSKSCEDFGSETLKELVDEFYQYLENDAFLDTEDPEEEDDVEEDDNSDLEDDEEENFLDEQEAT